MASRFISCSPWQCLSYGAVRPRLGFPRVDFHHGLRYREELVRSGLAEQMQG